MFSGLNDIAWVLNLRTDSLTYFFSIFPFFVSATFIFSVIALLYWSTLNKDYFGLIFTACFSHAYCSILKLVFMQNRPPLEYQLVPVDWQLGMPSGDVLFITFFCMAITRMLESRIIGIVSLLAIILVMCSRVYLGVHTPAQVFAGLFFGLILFLIHFTHLVQNVYKFWFIEEKLLSFWLTVFFFFVGLMYLFPEAAGNKTTLTIFGVLIGTGLSVRLNKPSTTTEGINFVRILFGLLSSYCTILAFNSIPTHYITLWFTSININIIAKYTMLTFNMLWFTPKICK